MRRSLTLGSVVAILLAALVLPLSITQMGVGRSPAMAQNTPAACGEVPPPAAAPSPIAPPEAQPITATPVISASPQPDDADLALQIKIGQLIMAGVIGTELTDDARHIITDLHIGNIILMGRNVDSPEQILSLTQDVQQLSLASNGYAALIGTDQEGGLVQRLNSASGFLPMPDAKTVGASLCPDAIRAYGQTVGEELNAVGVNVAFAPVLDVNSNPDNPVIGGLGRAFGATPEEVIQTAIPFMLGLHDAGVMAAGKHFPGHGSTTEDSHQALPFVTEDAATLQSVDLPPFQAAIDQGIDFIMPAHVTYEALDPSGMPATVSAPILTDLLRGELGYQGVIVTDDLGMQGIRELFGAGEAAVRAIEAGADLVLCVRMTITGACAPEDVEEIHSALLDAAQSGRLSMERIDQSLNRILSLKATYQVGPADGAGLDAIRGSAHFHALAWVLEEVANRRQEAGQP